MTDRYLSPADVCEMLPGMTLEILADRRKKRLNPPYLKPTGERGGVVLYRESDIRAWVEGSEVETSPGK